MIPNSLYEALPGLYMSSGTWALIAADGSVGALFGALLTSCGVLIAKLRWQYRRKRAQVF